MKKFFLPILVCLMLVVFASCNNSPKTREVIAKNPATLRVYSFQEYYPVGATPDKISGTLIYSPEGSSSIQTIDVKDSGVTKTGFDSTTAGEGRTLKLTYKGVDCVATYSIVAVRDYKISGSFVVDDNLVLSFKDNGKVEYERYASWKKFMDCDPIDDPVPEGTYESYLSTSGTSRIRVTPPSGVDQVRTFVPDGDGGLRLIPSDVEILEPWTSVWYLSAEKADSRSGSASGKYGGIQFGTDGTMKLWFLTDGEKADLGSLSRDPDVTIPADKIAIGIDGVKIKTYDAAANAKNFRMYLREDDYHVRIVSSSGDGYVGYSFSCVYTPAP